MITFFSAIRHSHFLSLIIFPVCGMCQDFKSNAIRKIEVAAKEQAIKSARNLIDCGNTGALYVMTIQTGSPGILKNKLLQCSPYLSDQVLLTAINKPNPLPAGILKEIIIANSPVTPHVYTALLNRTPKLPNGIMKEIDSTQTGTSARELLESFIEVATADIQLNTNELVRMWLLTDTIEKAIELLKASDKLVNKITLANLYLDAGMYVECHALVDSIEALGGAENTNFAALMNVILDLFESGKTIYDVDSAQIQILEQVAASGTRYAVTADGMLPRPFSRIFEDEIEKVGALPSAKTTPSYNNQFNNSNEKDEYMRDITHKNDNNSIKVYPNPNTGIFIAEIYLQESQAASFTLKNILGEQILKINIAQGKNVISLPKAQSINGIYFFEIKEKDYIVKYGKIIILR